MDCAKDPRPSASFSSGEKSDATALVCVDDNGSSTTDVKVLRCNLPDGKAAELWVRQYSADTNTSWICEKIQTKATRMVFHKVWRCQHNTREKASCRNTSCPAKLDIKIKKLNRNTMKNDPFLCRETPLQAVVKVSQQHNHSLQSADSLRLLRPSEETKEVFQTYFEDGMGTAQAISHHESVLAEKPNGHTLLANAMVNPPPRSVYRWHQQWRGKKYGPQGNPSLKLHENKSRYSAQGADVSITNVADDSWAVLVVTSIMSRAQQLESARDMIFVDSTSSCDETRSTITVLLTATKAGAVPVAVLIHSSQTREGYKQAFQLLKSQYPSCFGNSSAPAVFMTDNSRPEKDALYETWPSARQLLCHFHVLQAEWRWLTSTQNQVAKDERRHLMRAFQKILYAKTLLELQTAEEELLKTKHPAFIKRAQTFLKCQQEWVLFYRAGTVTRGHNTNNYSEASIRILKDIVLCRTKAYNAVALVEFILTNWEKYFEARLLRHAHNRDASHRVAFQHLLQKLPSDFAKSILHLGGTLYCVPSSSGTNSYEVDADIGFCSCWTGSQGAFCKHQAAVQKAFGGFFPNSPELTPQDRQHLGHLALGDRCPQLGFFLPMSSGSNNEEATTGACTSACSDEPMLEDVSLPEVPLGPLPDGTENPEDKEETYRKLEKELRRVHKLAEGSAAYDSLLCAFIAQLKNVNTSSAAHAIMLKLKVSSAADRRRGRIIKVQPTSLARRRPGLPRGSRRVPAGRPVRAAQASKTKRGHKLSRSIEENVPGAKGH